MSEQDASDAAGDAQEADVQGEAAPEESGGAASSGEDAGVEESADASTASGADDPAGGTGRDLDGEVDDELVERVENGDPESIAKEIAALRVEVDGLEAKLEDREETIADLEESNDELESKLARARADFQNYKKRTEERREEERERARAEVIEGLLDVHYNLRRALEQDEGADIRGGVESTLQQFDDVLDAEGVTVIEPAAGDEVDPHRHEVLVRVESDQPEGAIDDVHRIGYEMGDTIIREAQVTVSDGSKAAADDGEDAEEGADAADGEHNTDEE